MGVLVSRNPLVAALAHAGEAKDLAGDSESFLQQDWVRQLMRDAAKRGDELLAEGKWVEAMVIYGHAGLSGLDRDNLGYAEKLKRINHLLHQHRMGLRFIIILLQRWPLAESVTGIIHANAAVVLAQ